MLKVLGTIKENVFTEKFFVPTAVKSMPTSYSKTEKNVFAFNTLVESGFSLYTESLKDANVCILPNQVAAKHTNSSKAELIMSSLFDKVHSTICSSRTFSFTNHDGNQFHVGKLSIDWFCPTCKIGVMIEGSQKTLCLFHPKKVKAFFFLRTPRTKLLPSRR